MLKIYKLITTPTISGLPIWVYLLRKLLKETNDVLQQYSERCCYKTVNVIASKVQFIT